jgi:predicted metal-dependent enzyme (double-stranded beta helix superfamily)
VGFVGILVCWYGRAKLGSMSTGTHRAPLRQFLAQLDELRSGDIPDMDKVGRLLAELATDEEYFAPLIAQIPAESPGVHWLAKPERGSRLVLVHRPEGVMAYTHSHRCWVAIAPVRGVETHQHWNAVRLPGGRAELSLADEQTMHRGDAVTLVPPDDVHNHGHVLGTGPSPYSLILLGDDMLLFEREEYDPELGTWRGLAAGDPGRSHR